MVFSCDKKQRLESGLLLDADRKDAKSWLYRPNMSAFDEILKRGKRFQTPLFSVVFEKTEPFRIAVVISKKVAKKAVLRNRNKRLIRHILRELKGVFTGTCVVYIKKDISLMEHALLKQEVEKLMLYFNH